MHETRGPTSTPIEPERKQREPMPPIYAKSSIGERAAISATYAITSTNASCAQETTWPRAVRERTQATKEDGPKKVNTFQTRQEEKYKTKEIQEIAYHNSLEISSAPSKKTAKRTGSKCLQSKNTHKD